MREFRYDGARARYLSAELDPDAFQSGQTGQYTTYLTRKWTDYDGNSAYRDTFTTPAELGYMTGFEPGIGRIRDLHDDRKGGYYFGDHLGTVRGVGMISNVFTAFGEPRVANLDGGDNRFGYVGAWGYQAHDEIPFLHVGARYYDPSIGRFLQRDPIGIGGGLNVYEYVQSNPTVAIDPSGQYLGDPPEGPIVHPEYAKRFREEHKEAIEKYRQKKERQRRGEQNTEDILEELDRVNTRIKVLKFLICLTAGAGGGYIAGGVNGAVGGGIAGGGGGIVAVLD